MLYFFLNFSNLHHDITQVEYNYKKNNDKFNNLLSYNRLTICVALAQSRFGHASTRDKPRCIHHPALPWTYRTSSPSLFPCSTWKECTWLDRLEPDPILKRRLYHSHIEYTSPKTQERAICKQGHSYILTGSYCRVKSKATSLVFSRSCMESQSIY